MREDRPFNINKLKWIVEINSQTIAIDNLNIRMDRAKVEIHKINNQIVGGNLWPAVIKLTR